MSAIVIECPKKKIQKNYEKKKKRITKMTSIGQISVRMIELHAEKDANSRK